MASGRLVPRRVILVAIARAANVSKGSVWHSGPGDVTGRRILDAGCGSGPLLAALRDRGAVVTGIDRSAGMLEQARRRLGDDAELQIAELGEPLPFPDDMFDDVTASLVLHHLEDWGPALTELRRVLRPEGRLIVSVDHPFAVNLAHRGAGR